MIGGRESWVNLPKHVPIHITYFTAFVDDAGRLETRPDIYGFNARVERALGPQADSRSTIPREHAKPRTELPCAAFVLPRYCHDCLGW